MENKIYDNWQIEDGKDKDVVLSSRIRLARNLNNFKFPNQSSRAEKLELIDYLVDKFIFLTKNDYNYYLMNDLTEQERKLLYEKYLISRAHAYYPDAKALYLNNNNHISIMINEEDHLRLQILNAGLEFHRLWDQINQLDNKIDKHLSYAFSEKWGYLTSCPTNVGTALRASVMCHLPGLALSNKIDNILGAVGKFGLTVRGVNGEGSSSQGDLFQISNQITLGNSEEEIIEKLESVIKQIINEERKSRKYLQENKYTKLKDNVQRSLGILKHAYQIEETEALKYLSRIKFGQETNLLDERIPDNLFAEIMFQIRDAHLQIDNKLNENELNIKRAKKIRSILNRE